MSHSRPLSVMLAFVPLHTWTAINGLILAIVLARDIELRFFGRGITWLRSGYRGQVRSWHDAQGSELGPSLELWGASRSPPVDTTYDPEGQDGLLATVVCLSSTVLRLAFASIFLYWPRRLTVPEKCLLSIDMASPFVMSGGREVQDSWKCDLWLGMKSNRIVESSELYSGVDSTRRVTSVYAHVTTVSSTFVGGQPSFEFCTTSEPSDTRKDMHKKKRTETQITFANLSTRRPETSISSYSREGERSIKSFHTLLLTPA
ncbi:hypothetical protein PM082_002234 [Marasmius tenuissimus]|nr:hypothetical protein PM082_002234 [Marasmius tenuissimus]